MNILIVDDNKDFCNTLADIVHDFGHKAKTVYDPETALDYAAKRHKNLQLVMLDIEFGNKWQIDGLDVLEKIRINYPALQVVMISGKGTIESAVRATKLGAINFIEKSLVSKEKIEAVIESVAEKSGAPGEEAEIFNFLKSKGIYGTSKRMLEIGENIFRFGRTDLNVLISGETGTGKKLVARALHSVSKRFNSPFVTVDIPNIPRELFQSELFGHNKGSFSGASETKRGLFHQANKGTLFLDEIGDLSLDLQANLFIPIEEKTVRRVGSVEPEEMDIRFISATDRDLLGAMKTGKFREQLYHRLRECEIYLPPLSERVDDIPDISEFYLKKHNQEFSDSKHLSPSAMNFLKEQSWPGNVRELASLLRLVLQTVRNKETIEVSDIHKVMVTNKISSKPSKGADTSGTDPNTLKEALAMTDKKKIETTLEKYGGNVSKSAAKLGISRETLHNKIRKYEVDVQFYRDLRKKKN